jgi:hypothetical protein
MNDRGKIVVVSGRTVFIEGPEVAFLLLLLNSHIKLIEKTKSAAKPRVANLDRYRYR